MNPQNNSDYKALIRAIAWAKAHGYKVPPLEEAVFYDDGSGLRESLRRWAMGLLYEHDFAKAIFGNDLVNEHEGYSYGAIRMWAKQVAVEHMGKIIKVNGDRPYLEVVTYPEVEYSFDEPPASVVNAERTVIELRNMAASVPFMTHEIQDIDVVAGIPAWKWHLQQMIVSDNPFVYLNDYIDTKETITD